MTLRLAQTEFSSTTSFIASIFITLICFLGLLGLLGITVIYIWPRTVIGKMARSISMSDPPPSTPTPPTSRAGSRIGTSTGTGAAATNGTTVAATTNDTANAVNGTTCMAMTTPTVMTEVTTIAIAATGPKSMRAPSNLSLIIPERSPGELTGDEINEQIKWLVTLYIAVSLVMMGMSLIEQIVYTTVEGSTNCSGSFYYTILLSYSRVFLYLFYFVRVDVVFRKSVFQISTWMYRLLTYLPTITFLIVMTSRILYGRLHACHFQSDTLRALMVSVVLVDVGWTISLFIFFFYKLRQLIIADAICKSIKADLRGLMKKLFRLYIITQSTTIILGTVTFIPSLREFRHICGAFDTFAHSVTMLLSFKFAHAQYTAWCLCHKEQ